MEFESRLNFSLKLQSSREVRVADAIVSYVTYNSGVTWEWIERTVPGASDAPEPLEVPLPENQVVPLPQPQAVQSTLPLAQQPTPPSFPPPAYQPSAAAVPAVQPSPTPVRPLAPPPAVNVTTSQGLVSDPAIVRRAQEMMGEEPKYDIDQLAERTGLSRKKVEDYWLWLGIPITHINGPLFTEFDVDSLLALKKLIQSEQLEDSTIASLVRSVGHNAERMASWQFEALVENATLQLNGDAVEARRRVVQRFPHIASSLDIQAKHAYQIGATRVLQQNMQAEANRANPNRGTDNRPGTMAVGFADIVGFTKRTAAMDPTRLTAYIHSYEARTRDIVTQGGGRVVKMVGDAVLFLADDLSSGIPIALALADTESNAKTETPMRVGMVWGQVVQRFGDVFGSRVNLAARLTDIASPNTLYVDPSTAALLAGDRQYHLAVLPEAQIQGLGLMRPVKVSFADPNRNAAILE